jgi:hypothetical protein
MIWRQELRQPISSSVTSAEPLASDPNNGSVGPNRLPRQIGLRAGNCRCVFQSERHHWRRAFYRRVFLGQQVLYNAAQSACFAPNTLALHLVWQHQIGTGAWGCRRFVRARAGLPSILAKNT